MAHPAVPLNFGGITVDVPFNTVSYNPSGQFVAVQSSPTVTQIQYSGPPGIFNISADVNVNHLSANLETASLSLLINSSNANPSDAMSLVAPVGNVGQPLEINMLAKLNTGDFFEVQVTGSVLVSPIGAPGLVSDWSIPLVGGNLVLTRVL